jgi:hypothetical protein
LLGTSFASRRTVGGNPIPDPAESIDLNCDGVPDIFDVLLMINYIFVNGPAPCR